MTYGRAELGCQANGAFTGLCIGYNQRCIGTVEVEKYIYRKLNEHNESLNNSLKNVQTASDEISR